jgi:TPP-dependent pyruvate/acetoin dehydrogenase alpha subunit
VEAAERAVDTVRGSGGPCFLELRTYRYRAHSMYDPELYRDKAEVASWRERDPIEGLADELRSAGALDDASFDALVEEVDAEIEAAVEVAEASPLEPVEDLETHVYAPAATAAGGGAR